MDVKGEQVANYEYLDSGDGARLERFGPYAFSRPSPIAIWPREQPDLWSQADGVHERDKTGEGHWTFRRKLPPSWPVRCDGLTLHVKPTGFGHVGLFPEHAGHWPWLDLSIRSRPGICRVLHLFAYTGAMSLAAARAGAEVCHVDAVEDINAWARRNAEISGLKDAPIRWITDDAMKFVGREIRRGRRYDGVILDPPSYGRGPGGEKWILERDLARLFDMLIEVAASQPAFVLFTCHNPGFSPPLMRNMLVPWAERFGGSIEEGTMVLKGLALRRVLPAGFYARWRGGDA